MKLSIQKKCASFIRPPCTWIWPLQNQICAAKIWIGYVWVMTFSSNCNTKRSANGKQKQAVQFKKSFKTSSPRNIQREIDLTRLTLFVDEIDDRWRC